ncbi:MAG: acyl-CoA dehydrogenase family protein [Betaproteobacteria bacterium]|nr:MAG: acyl-CoA dehydrogenase family protein [Betaproteobacteria bacterium]
MNLEFSPDHEAMRQQVRKLLAGARPRGAFEGTRDPTGVGDAALWRQLAELGWLATAVPDAHGGSGLDALALCVLAEEAGRHLAAVPLTASACSFTHALLGFANDPAVQALLPRLADGSACGVLLTDDCWPPGAQLRETMAGAVLSGRARNVLDGAAATHALSMAGDGAEARLVLFAIDERSRAAMAPAPLDLLHPCCRCWPAVTLPARRGSACCTTTRCSSPSSSSGAPRPRSMRRAATACSATPSAARSARSRR